MKSKFIKSKERVKNHGEVFTPQKVVKDMCDLLNGTDVWARLETTFLEPCCGNGNILVEILNRKYNLCHSTNDGLTALLSVVGIDILPDNVLECRVRLFGQFTERFPTASAEELICAANILSSHIMQGDSLKIMDKWRPNND